MKPPFPQRVARFAGAPFSALTLLGLLGLSACSAPDESATDLESVIETADGLTCVTLRRPVSTVSDATLVSDPLDPSRANVNLGATTTLRVGAAGTSQSQALVSFDLGSIPANVPVISALFQLTKAQSIGSGPVLVHAASAPWQESQVTSGSFGGSFDPAVIGSFDPSPVPTNGNIQLDITGVVAQWNQGTLANHGLLLEEPTGGRSQFGASEAGPALRPMLTVCYSPPTCADGLQNQGETGVDCGGPCGACVSCNDGLQNQGETGVDCGGPCAPCPSCNDGLQNQGETGVDCGGPCAPCASCNDGLQNQGETGVDCGGPCAPCACVPGSTQSCYSGPAGTLGVGICAAGSQVCDAQGSGFGACVGDVLPQAESCATAVNESCAPACGDVYWVNGTGGAAPITYFENIVYAPNGEIVVTGAFENTLNFGNGPLTASSWRDAYVARLTAAGAPLWSQRWTGLNAQDAMDSAVDAQGNVFVTGHFTDSISFGNATAASAGDYDIFLVKLDPQGNLLWAKRYGDAALQSNPQLALDASGNVYLTGVFQGSIQFGGPGGTITASGGSTYRDAFITKLTPGGGHLWSRTFQPSDYAGNADIVTSPSGDVVITGGFSGTASAPYGIPGVVTSVVTGADTFVAKLTTLGAPGWFKTFQGSVGARAAVAANGDIVLGGAFLGTANVGGADLTAPPFGTDVLLARYDGNGNHLWSHGYGTSGNQSAHAITLDANGDIYLTGSYNQSVDFGNGLLDSNGGTDLRAFVVKFDGAANPIWSRQYGTTTSWTGTKNEGRSLAVNGTALAVMGVYTPGTTFDANNVLPGYGVFITTLAP